MNRSTPIFLTLVALISVASGCSEPTRPYVNTAPKAFAGQDVRLYLPANTWVLDGSATDSVSTIDRYLWRKVSGPASYSIESPGMLQTKVTRLERGTYEFELTATDAFGLTGKDTVAIFVENPPNPATKELIYRNLEWRCPWYCNLLVENFWDLVPKGTAIRVFLGSSDIGSWAEIKPAGNVYEYHTYDNHLEILADDENGVADVLITF